MKRVLAASITAMVLLVPAMAMAAGHPHYEGPEPLTAIGLVLGAAGVGVARWASSRKSRSR
jgi:hypothetical protein